MARTRLHLARRRADDRLPARGARRLARDPAGHGDLGALRAPDHRRGRWAPRRSSSAERASARPPGPARAGARGRRGAHRRGANPTLVALGGGRVIDAAKAIAAVRGGRVVRDADHALRRRDDARSTASRRAARRQARHLVRPALVIADPVEMTTPRRPPPAGQRHERARATAPRRSTRRSPTRSRTLAALRGAELIASALDQPSRRARPRPRSRSARSSAPTRSTRPGSPFTTSSARRSSAMLEHPARGDQRDDAAADDGRDARRAPPRRSTSLAHGARHRARRDPVADRSRSAAARAGSATSAPTPSASRRRVERDPRAAELRSRPIHRTGDELRDARGGAPGRRTPRCRRHATAPAVQ